jgi:hypothetical protein
MDDTPGKVRAIPHQADIARMELATSGNSRRSFPSVHGTGCCRHEGQVDPGGMGGWVGDWNGVSSQDRNKIIQMRY